MDEQIVITPMSATGPQGPSGPEMKIQYSSDSLSWHETPEETDKYLRFSTDNGATWSDAVYFNNLAETLEWVEKARQWAENPEDEPVESGQYSALHHKEKALAAQDAAETAQTNAETAEANALASEVKARQWAENPEDEPVEEDKYSALHHKEKAVDAQIAAEAAEANALASANKAAKWAQEDEDVEVEAGKYSAYHWAQKAEDIAVSPMHGDEAHTEDYVKEDDPRLTDARTPTEHASTHVNGTDDIQLATSTQKGLMSSTYAEKLDGIEANANNYIHPVTHSLDMITETPELKIMTADERDRLATIGGIPI